MPATVATTFAVSDVQPATTPLPETPCKRAVEGLLSPKPEEPRNPIDRRWARRASAGRAPVPAAVIEACSRYHGKLLDRVAYHPVVAAVHAAFDDHRPLVLSPDAVWLMIAQGVANHVNANAEELRPRLVRHDGKIAIKVRRDDFVKGSPENPWPEVFREFSEQVRERVGPAADLFAPAFSTTGPVERAAADVVLLDAMQSYFEYALRSRCGIPSLTLEGTADDWQALADRAERFAEFGLERWIEVLRPILAQFVRASRGDVETSFWRSMYRLNDQSGGPVITGWLTAFFPYWRDRDSYRAEVPVASLLKPNDPEDDLGPPTLTLYHEEWEGPPDVFIATSYFGPTTDHLPNGLSRAPFTWEHRERRLPMEFLGGFVGVAQDEATLALRPEIGWAVRPAPAPTES